MSWRGLRDPYFKFIGRWCAMEERADRFETFVVAEGERGQRLDRLLAARVSELSRSQLKALIRAGEVTIAGRAILDPEHRVEAGATITLHVPPPIPAQPQGENIPLTVIYEDQA